MPPDPRSPLQPAPSVAGAAGAIPYVLLTAAVLFIFLVVPAPTATAQETTGETTRTTPGGIEVNDGEVSIDGGEVYAGDGCAKAGDVVAGDCEGEGRGDDDGSTSEEPSSQEDTSQETTDQETTFLREDTIAEETTGLEATSPGTTAPVGDELCPAEPPEDAVEATVERAVDGDTLELAEEARGADKVRLVGVDAPELEGGDGEPEPYAEEAASFTAGALEGRTALLQVGEEETDDYRRLLAYVWTAPEGGVVGDLKRMVGMGGPELFNRTLLEEGYAEVLTIEQGGLYGECFEAAERSAREEEAGIWATGGTTDGQYGGQTTPEIAPERTFPEDTASEGTVLQETTAEGDLSEDTTGHLGPESAPPQAGVPELDPGESAGDDPAAQDQYGPEQGPAEASYSAPEYENCESPDILDSFSGDGERTESIEVPGGSFLIAYRSQETAAGEPGAFHLDVYGPRDESVEQISYEEAGTDRAYVEEGPGEFIFSADGENRAYDVAVYGCGEEIARDLPGEGEAPDGEPAEQGSLQTQYAEPAAPEEQAALPVSPETAEAPARAPAQQMAYEPAAAQTPGVPRASLPTRQTPAGSVAVLPETGGPSPRTVVLDLGAASLLAGLAVLWHLRRGYPDGR
jgi:micrococcal nuclease